MQSLFMFPLLLVFLTVTYAAGSKILRHFGLQLDSLEEYLIATALGSAILIFFTLALAVTNLLYKEAFIILSVVVMAISAHETRQLAKKIKGTYFGIRQRLKPDITGLLLSTYLLFIAAIGIATLAPVSEFDSLSYHLAFAKIYAQNHGFVYQATQIYTTMPQGMTMLYAIAELFSAPNLSSMIAYTFGVLGSLSIFSIVRKRHSEKAALAGTLIFFTAPAIIERLPQTTVDLSLTFFFLTSIIVLLKYTASLRWHTLALAGTLIGTATTIKLTGLLSAATAGAAGLLSCILFRKINLKHWVIFGLITLAILSPWLILSQIYTGNPLYPQAQSTFGGNYLDESLTNLYANYHDSVGLERTIFNAAIVLWNITFKSEPFGPVIGLTPFFIMVLPLGFLFRGRQFKVWLIMLAMGLTILTIQFWVHPVIRYMFPGIALLSIAAGMTIDSMMRERLLKMALIALLIASLTFNAAIWYGINTKNINYLLSGESDSDYYSKLKDHNSYGAQEWINLNTPYDSKVLLFNEPRGYFLDRQYIMSSPYQTYIDYSKMSSAEELRKRLNELGVTHILVNNEFFDTYSHSVKGSRHPNELVGKLTLTYGKIVYEKGDIKVYRIH